MQDDWDSICCDSLGWVVFEMVEGFSVAAEDGLLRLLQQLPLFLLWRFLNASDNYFKWKAVFTLPGLNGISPAHCGVYCCINCSCTKACGGAQHANSRSQGLCASFSGQCFTGVFIKLSKRRGWTHVPKCSHFIGEKDSKRHRWLENARQLVLKDEQKHSEKSCETWQPGGVAEVEAVPPRLKRRVVAGVWKSIFCIFEKLLWICVLVS